MANLNTYVIEYSFDNSSRYHSTVKAEHINGALEIANIQGSEVSTEGIPSYAELKASNYHDPQDSNWSQTVIDARQKRLS